MFGVERCHILAINTLKTKKIRDFDRLNDM